MKTGLKNLDKVFNIERPQLVILTGNNFVNMLSGDIANYVCLTEENGEVLEVVNQKKEYLIKRLFINETNVNYNKWCLKDKYTEAELKQIGQATVNLIETTNRLPTIIENDFYDLKGLKKYIYKWVNSYADRGKDIYSLVVLDLYPFNKCNPAKDKVRFEEIRFAKVMSKYSKKYSCPILMVCTNENILNKISKYVDRIIKLGRKADYILDVDIIEKGKKVNSCKLRYNVDIRKFEDC